MHYGIGTVNMNNNEFTNNASENGGGAIINGFGAVLNATDCNFNTNNGGWGGAIFNQNDFTTLNLEGCIFDRNETLGTGGSVYLWSGGQGFINNCVFNENAGDFGGNITCDEVDSAEEGSVMIINSVIQQNTTTTQGGGLNIVDYDATIYNTLIAQNFNSGSGAGGGLSINCTDSNTVVVNLINNTIVGNFAQLGSGIATYSTANMTECTTNIQNSLLFNEGKNYKVEDGNPILMSLGGNLSGDGMASTSLTHGKDINNSPEPSFKDKALLNYRPTNGSIVIDAGVADGTPVSDLDGNPRIGDPDSGAYEFMEPSGNEETFIESSFIQLKPNPVAETLTYNLKTDWQGELSWRIYDVQGKLAIAGNVNNMLRVDDKIDVSLLSMGLYDFVIGNGTEAVSVKLLKRP